MDSLPGNEEGLSLMRLDHRTAAGIFGIMVLAAVAAMSNAQALDKPKCDDGYTQPGTGDFLGYCWREGNENDLVSASPTKWAEEMSAFTVENGGWVAMALEPRADGVWVRIRRENVQEGDYASDEVLARLISRTAGGGTVWYPAEIGFSTSLNDLLVPLIQ